MGIQNPSAPPRAHVRVAGNKHPNRAHRTGGLQHIHATPDGPRYATRKDFVYGEDVTIGEWTIPTDGLPRYRDEESGQDSVSG